MSYRWVAALAPGALSEDDDLAGAGLDQEFPDQASAEAWLTGAYEDLADLGVESVSLHEEDRLVYGPMSLSDY